MIDKIQNWDADWDDVIDPSESPESVVATECAICGCTPKPDEWSSRVDNCCIDCA
tara:strand:+ start:499 stop:663 length:165 start_codon:yes stop_codon:yes gene_type:complete